MNPSAKSEPGKSEPGKSEMGKSEPAVVLSGVNAWYGDTHVLRDVDLTVARGERVVVCGSSGSGKSTLIRCINGLQPHLSGSIAVTGIRLDGPAALEAVRARVGMVFQSFELFPHLTVLENCTLGPVHVRRLARAEAEALARHHLARLRIPEKADARPADLSGGQRQRVAIARALCMEPAVMLFDEPTSALDPEMVEEVLEAMVDLARSGMTMVCVTHEMGFARRVADRIVVMDQGQVVEVAPTDAFFAGPRHPRSRAVLGLAPV
ncbi:amino acid ABC transporter ATP-binding protein [Methylobacterium sp. Leaf466]|uniref:amino acid ABC transporter ATP-binding protein n=1 Tax=Methylobacterium sp. Leaf466 TaxID=1736386 RepID=UPI0009E974EA|nr:amino acid ABC transporter ATP-binding protein [Methylobacterium sp. Leaf466]